MSSARNLTLTLFGRFLRERGSWIAISHLVQLLEPLGIEPASTRTMATLHLLDGMTLQEVADAVGLSVSGVRKRLRTFQAKLKDLEP